MLKYAEYARPSNHPVHFKYLVQIYIFLCLWKCQGNISKIHVSIHYARCTPPPTMPHALKDAPQTHCMRHTRSITIFALMCLCYWLITLIQLPLSCRDITLLCCKNIFGVSNLVNLVNFSVPLARTLFRTFLTLILDLCLLIFFKLWCIGLWLTKWLLINESTNYAQVFFFDA